jgi:hypothetical protein
LYISSLGSNSVMNEFVNVCQTVDDAVSSHEIDQSLTNFCNTCNILENVCNPLFKRNVTNNISSNIRKKMYIMIMIVKI